MPSLIRVSAPSRPSLGGRPTPLANFGSVQLSDTYARHSDGRPYARYQDDFSLQITMVAGERVLCAVLPVSSDTMHFDWKNALQKISSPSWRTSSVIAFRVPLAGRNRGLDSRAVGSVSLDPRVGYAPRLAGRLEATPAMPGWATHADALTARASPGAERGVPMKTLPDNPNLDHLRRQAKDLLAGLRDSHPDATLADAQASLAEQYGFRAWPDLKAEVDRRQGRADLADPALARQIATLFGLGGVLGEMRSVSRPDEMGRRWLLETDRGRWAPRTVDDVFPVTDGEDNARFQDAAAQAGVTVPACVRSGSGAVVEVIAGSRWRVYEWLQSGPPLAAPVNATISHAVGGILATIHGLRVPVDGVCPWSSVRFATIGWAELADLAAAKGAGWAPVLAAAVPTLVELESVDGGTTPAEPVLCHNNLSPGNVRVGVGGRLIVAGWEHASGLPPEWELSAALVNRAVNPGGGVNATGARALVDGYRARAGSLPPLSLDTFRGTATALQNYVSGQIDLALNARDDEDARYSDRNVRHLLTHLPSRATFERVLEVALKAG
jgi:hypothetical protein